MAEYIGIPNPGDLGGVRIFKNLPLPYPKNSIHPVAESLLTVKETHLTVEGGVVREMNQTEKNSVDSAVLAKAKLEKKASTDEISQWHCFLAYFYGLHVRHRHSHLLSGALALQGSSG